MIDCYWAPTANSRKVTMMLEECELAYRRRRVDLAAGEQSSAEHLKLNPAGAVPVIVDDAGSKAPVIMTQSLAICIYLAEKSGKLLPLDRSARASALQWSAFGASDMAAPTTALYLLSRPGREQPEAQDIIRDRLARYLAVLDGQLSRGEYLAGAFSMADILVYPTLLVPFVEEVIGRAGPFANIRAWTQRMAARPAIARGM